MPGIWKKVPKVWLVVCKSRGQPKKTDVSDVSRDKAIDIETVSSEVAGSFAITSTVSRPCTPITDSLSFWEAAGLL